MDARDSQDGARSARQAAELERMLADAVLPETVRPMGAPGTEASPVVLLTGATGFLGRQAAREILRDPAVRLICLIRDTARESAALRLDRTLSELGISAETRAAQVEVLSGDLAAPALALDAMDYAQLAERVTVIYHCAARVDWVRGYRRLHAVNVGGVLNLIRLGCTGRSKRLVFVSSLAVCYSRSGPDRIDEATDMLPYIAGMPLGYARSKCVAESLLRQAAARGLPVTVLRPALISGHSRSGKANNTDLIAALLQGCTTTGLAIDTDWLLDCVPVDFVARVMARVPQGEDRWRVLNLPHRRPRQWRELVLWLNLHGYPVKLVDADTWLDRLFRQRRARATLLFGQRLFFVGRPGDDGRPYQAYLAGAQARIDSSRTRGLLATLGLEEAELDADLLHRYCDHYQSTGILPARPGRIPPRLSWRRLLDAPWQANGNAGLPSWLPVAERQRIGIRSGLLSELASAREAESVGLWHLRAPTGRDLVLKAKPDDDLMLDLGIRLAGLCRPELGELLRRFPQALGLNQCQEREIALYAGSAPGLRRHMPRCHAVLRGFQGRRWAILMEHLPHAGEGGGGVALRTTDPGMAAVIDGLAEIHSVWLGRERELLQQPWLAPPPDAAAMIEMKPLWRALADFSAPWLTDWAGPGIRAEQQQFIDELADWWPKLQALPATLIHNDFNPRNLALQTVAGKPCLRVFDWELATLGLPQQDLAELLCFTCRPNLTNYDLDALLERHRQALTAASGQRLDPHAWRTGFALALRHLLINRLPLYCLLHRFRPLDYLPRVIASWHGLYRMADGDLSDSKSPRY